HHAGYDVPSGGMVMTSSPNGHLLDGSASFVGNLHPDLNVRIPEAEAQRLAAADILRLLDASPGPPDQVHGCRLVISPQHRLTWDIHLAAGGRGVRWVQVDAVTGAIRLNQRTLMR